MSAVYAGGGNVRIRVGESTSLALQAATNAAVERDGAEAAAQVAAAFSGPLYPSISAGLAGSTSGQEFAVDNLDGTATIYLDNSGTAVLRRTIIIDPSADGAAAQIGTRMSGTGTVSRRVSQKLFRSPEDHGVDYSGSVSDQARITNFFDATAPTLGFNGEFIRHGGRQYFGDWAVFNGAFGGYFDYTGLSPLTRALHNWAPREATLGVDSHWGSMAIVGHSLASKRENWPAAASSFTPATIGVSGFAINDMPVGQAWGLYGDAVRMANSDGFTAGCELAVANFGDNSLTTPFTLVNGSAKGGVGLWVQPGAGMSVIAADLAQAGLSVSDVNHISALIGLVSMDLGGQTVVTWQNNTAYVVNNSTVVQDPQSGIVFRCLVPHTSPSSGTFAADRAANPNRWKQNPGALSGIVFGAGTLAERAPGANFFSAIEMPQRYSINWQRETAGGAIEDAGVIFADAMPDGTPPTQLILRPFSVFTNGVFAGSADGTTGAMIQGRGSGGANAFSFRWTGTNIEFFVDNILVKTL